MSQIRFASFPNPPSSMQGLRKVVLICALVAVLCLFAVCGPKVNPEEANSLKAEISSVQAQIRSAETEDAKYAGGLIKSLIGVRIGILRQTEAMLQQRSKAFTFGLALKFTIDGKPFVPPDPANDLLRGVEQEIAGNLAQIRSQEVEAARYSGGLVLAMSLSTLATMRQTQAMLDQKRLALKYGLPQYIGFRSQADSVAPATNITPRTEVPASANEKDWGIVGVDTRVTESNTVWSKYAWKLTLRNDSDRPQVFQGTIEFQDSDGFIVDTSSANDLVVPAKSAQVFTGFALIRAEVAEKVARTSAKIGKIR